MANKTFYVTTAIDYVNASPHLGHAFEKCIADAISRWHRLKKENVFFLTGVDENAQKNVQAAEAAGVPVKEFIDKNTKFFKELCNKLNINYDKFIRTTAQEHIKIVQEILNKVIKKGDVYKGNYKGYYCTGCESFIKESDLVNGKCPEHNKEPEYMEEEAYFFKLSKYKDKLVKFVQDFIIPESKKKEILSRLNQELNDLCISRKGAKLGIDFPNDKDFKIYVWIDALCNYISGAQKKWPADLHVIGKGINWFHSVIWPALLMSAGYKLPKKLLVHGYINIAGKKMSKSLGNSIDPLKLLEKYNTDSIRYSLLKCSIFEDSDFSEEILIQRHNTELANKLGNLISRVSTLAEKYGLEKTPNKLLKKLKLKKIEELFNKYELDKALSLVFEFIDECNGYIQEKKPWETKNKKVLFELIDSIKAISILLYPFIPSTCEKVAKQFSFDLIFENINKPIKNLKIKKSEILFDKIEFNQENKKIDSKPIQNKQNKLKKSEERKEDKKEERKEEKMGETISYKDWQKIDLRIGTIKAVKQHPDADKLLLLEIDLGNETRTLVAGLKQHYNEKDLKGKQCVVFTNLEPKEVRGVKSKGMILAAVNEDHSKVFLLGPDKKIEPGSRIS